jgi:hypothetical protein
MTPLRERSSRPGIAANVLLVVWLVVWPFTAVVGFVEGLTFDPAAAERPAGDRRLLLIVGSIIGVAMPLLAAWIARRSRAWRTTSLLAAAIGAVLLMWSGAIG